MSTAAIVGGVAAAGQVAGGLFGASQASDAAQTQADAAKQGAQRMGAAVNQTLPMQENIWGQSQQNYAPYQQLGLGATNALSSMMGFPGSSTPSGTSQLMRPGSGIPPVGSSTTAASSSMLQPTSLTQGWTQPFQAPTAAQAAATPGYQFQLGQGLNAIQNSAAARGSLLDTGTMKSLNNYAQGVASTNYNNVYNQAMQQYQQNANTFYTNQANMYNRLTGTAAMGQNATGNLASLGLQTGNQMGNTIMGGAANVNQQYQNAAQATAYGQQQQGAIMGNMFNNVGQIPLQLWNAQNGTASMSNMVGNNGGQLPTGLGINDSMPGFGSIPGAIPGTVAQPSLPTTATPYYSTSG